MTAIGGRSAALAGDTGRRAGRLDGIVLAVQGQNSTCSSTITDSNGDGTCDVTALSSTNIVSGFIRWHVEAYEPAADLNTSRH